MSLLDEQKVFDLIVKANNQQSEQLKTDLHDSLLKINQKVDANAKEVSLLKIKYSKVDRKARRNNIVVFGLNIKKDNLLKGTKSEINKLLQLQIIEADIKNIHPLGKTDSAPILIEFIAYLKKKSIFDKVKLLAGTGVTITHDLAPGDRLKQKILRKHLKTAREQKLDATIKGEILVIAGQDYSVDDLIILEKQAEIIDTEAESDEMGKDIVETQTNGTQKDSKDPKNIFKSLQPAKKRKLGQIQYSPPSAAIGENRKTRSQTKDKNTCA